MPVVVRIIFVRKTWPRSDKAHVSFQNVEKLRELVDARPPDKATDGSDHFFIDNFYRAIAIAVPMPPLDKLLGLLDAAAVLIAPQIHRPKFVKVEFPAIFTDPDLLVEYRTVGRKLDKKGDNEKRN